jgi:hypothetical protein
MSQNEQLNEFVDHLLEAYFNAGDDQKGESEPKRSALDEINWNEPDLADVSSRCMSLQQVKDFFNSELQRYKDGGKASQNMPRIAKGLIVGDGGKPIEPMDFAKLLSLPPKSIFDKGEKSLHTVDDQTMTINTGIPALRGIIWDQEHNEFRVVNTCPGAGKCAVDCYALQGFYIFQNGKNLKLQQRLQLIFTNPENYFAQGFREAEMYAFEANRDGKMLQIRWNDAGDFFSERYLKLALRITKSLLDKQYKIKSYFYTKVGKMVELGEKLGFTVNFSQGGIQDAPSASKRSIIVPKEVFSPFLSPTKGRGYEKDATGKSKFRDESAREGLKKAIFHKYHKSPENPNSHTITVDNIKFTDELPKIEGKPGEFNVIVLPGGDTDAPAQRKDVQYIFLLKH